MTHQYFTPRLRKPSGSFRVNGATIHRVLRSFGELSRRNHVARSKRPIPARCLSGSVLQSDVSNVGLPSAKPRPMSIEAKAAERQAKAVERQAKAAERRNGRPAAQKVVLWAYERTDGWCEKDSTSCIPAGSMPSHFVMKRRDCVNGGPGAGNYWPPP